jgi:hypothetical protein
MRVWYVCYIIMLSSAGVLIRHDSPVLLPDMHCCQHAFVLFISMPSDTLLSTYNCCRCSSGVVQQNQRLLRFKNHMVH